MESGAIKTAILTWMTRETGLTCIYARQAGPRPTPPYGSILITNPAIRIGGQDELRANGDKFSQTGLRTTILSLNIFGEGANDKMNKLRDSLDRPDVIQEFESAGLAHHGEEGPTDLTELEDTSYLERSQMDLTVSYAKNYNNLSGVMPIDSVEVEGEVQTSPDPNNEPMDIELEVDSNS